MRLREVKLGINSAGDVGPVATLGALGIGAVDLRKVVSVEAYAGDVCRRIVGTTQGKRSGATQVYFRLRWFPAVFGMPIHKKYSSTHATLPIAVMMDLDSVRYDHPDDRAVLEKNKKKRSSDGVPKRRSVSADTKRRHVKCVGDKFGGRCPNCFNEVIVVDGFRVNVSHVDHWTDNRNRNRPTETWLICAGCNGGFQRHPTLRTERRPRFEVYQDELSKVTL